MLAAFARRFFDSANDRYVNKLKGTVTKINALEPGIAALSDAELAAKTPELRAKLAQGASLTDILPEAFAVVREGAKRSLGMRHFDVQLIGGMVLHEGKIAEMHTGEGKTLVATLAAYLNALPAKGVHVVTVNDYLAERDAAWMGKLYTFLGLSVGCIKHGLTDAERKQAYAADITYATNNELGFDYLRDNMKFSLEEMVQRGHTFAIVDEVDSILIDEARTPLIISGPTEGSTALYTALDPIMKRMPDTGFELEEKHRNVTMTEEGQVWLEEALTQAGLLEKGSLYDMENISLQHHASQALKAHKLFTRDKDYIVKDNKVIIIDEFTGRMMEGRRYSDGLHQAIEAKEGVTIQKENQTLASITFQNYFRLYERLSGMTGTAMTEAAEFSEIYNLDVVEIPTNVAVSRIDHDDEIYRTAKEKLDAIVLQIEECHKRHQPVLVGTVSIAKSEELSAILKKKKIKHEVLNARHHAREAAIISDAGKPNAVTIATNMAGRGTDIQLGGNLENMLHGIDDPKKQDDIRAQHAKDKQAVQDAGGLFVIGSERHESRRIDNQLRGRSGRQGDKGGSKFFISLQDDLMRIFGSERIDSMLQSLGLEEGEAIVHPWLNKAMERAQKRVEARNFDIRKNLLKYDDVMNEQRKIIYEQRLDIMQSESVTDVVDDMRHEVVESLITTYMPPKSYPEEWDMAALSEDVKRIFGLTLPLAEWAAEEGVANEEIQQRLQAAVDAQIKDVRETNGVDLMRFAEKSILLQLLDQQWKDHLHTLDQLRQGINLRAYGQRDPLNEYKREAFDLFALMLEKVREMVTTTLARLRIQATSIADVQTPRTADTPMLAVHKDPNTVSPLGHDESNTPDSGPRVVRSTQAIDPNDPSTWGRVMRNEPCPCGSGKKYKYCHGLLE